LEGGPLRSSALCRLLSAVCSSAISAAEAAGLQEGDVLLTVGGTTATNYNWNMLLGQYRPGDRVVLQVRRFRGTQDVTLVLGDPQHFSYRLEEIPGAPRTAGDLRNSWLTGK